MWDEYKESPKMQETNDNTFNRNEIFVAFQIYFGQEIDDYDKIFTHLFELVSDKTHVFKVFSFINYIYSKENSSELVNFDALNAIFNISTCSEYHFKYVLGTIQILDSQQNFEYLSSIDYQIFLTTIDKYHNSHEILHLSLHYLDKCISHLKTVDIYTTVLDFFQFFNQTYQFYFELPEFCIITKNFNSIIDDYDGYDYSVCFSSSGLFYEYLFNDEYYFSYITNIFNHLVIISESYFNIIDPERIFDFLNRINVDDLNTTRFVLQFLQNLFIFSKLCFKSSLDHYAHTILLKLCEFEWDEAKTIEKNIIFQSYLLFLFTSSKYSNADLRNSVHEKLFALNVVIEDHEEFLDYINFNDMLPFIGQNDAQWDFITDYYS